MPKVSVVIPLYNKAPHISRTINSVLAQTVQDFEIVVVDDGSTDNGGQIVASYTDPRIRLIRQENQGVSAARNRGISEARSDFLAFLDADDEWGNDHLEVLLRLRENFPEAGAYSTAYIHVYSEGKIIVPARIKKIPPAPWEGLIPDYFLSASFGEPPVCSSAVAIPREIFDTAGFFKVGEKMGEDLDMWGRIALSYDVVFSWEGKILYRKDAIARACEQNRLSKDLPFVKSAYLFFGSETIPYYVKMYINNLRFQYIDSLIISGHKKEAMRNLLTINLHATPKITILKIFIFLIMPISFVVYLKKIKNKITMAKHVIPPSIFVKKGKRMGLRRLYLAAIKQIRKRAKS